MEERTRYETGTPDVYEPPTPEEFRELLARWELTGAAAGALVGVNGRQVRRYTGGQTAVPYALLFTLAMKKERVAISAGGWRAELRAQDLEIARSAAAE